jgi:hypothetical protein
MRPVEAMEEMEAETEVAIMVTLGLILNGAGELMQIHHMKERVGLKESVMTQVQVQ